MVPHYLRFARALALASVATGLAACAASSGTADALDVATDAAAPACDLDAADVRHYIAREGDAFTASCPAQMPTEGAACAGCVWCNYDLGPPTGECWCTPAEAVWRCNLRMNTLAPPDLALT